MKKYKAIISYDGTEFFGWQIQPTAPTITSCLQRAFKNVFKQPITIIGASRTDTGVHALGQVATFKTGLSIKPEMIKSAWNYQLPKSIFIRDIQEVDEKFHPCRNVKQKTYFYHLFFQKAYPFLTRFGWHYEFMHHVDFEKLKLALDLYKGTHNFGSFCKIEDPNKSPIRTIDDITMEKIKRYNILRITIKGQSFLRFQIRRMIGYALDVSRRKDLPISYLKEILDNPNPQQNLLKADSCGLCLRKVLYHD